jgi:putative intracellular protease/amidase
VAADVRIAIAVFEGAEELDFVGPWEVLGAWRFLHPDEVDVFLVGETMEPVACAKGMHVLPDRTWDEAGEIDVLLYPGGRGTRAQLGDEAVRARLRGLRDAGTLMTSVCTGSLVYADAGLLDGRPATTYHGAFGELLPLGHEIEPRPDDRFVDDGEVITAAGVSAGIDMALHLVGRLASARALTRGASLHPVRPRASVLAERADRFAERAAAPDAAGHLDRERVELVRRPLRLHHVALHRPARPEDSVRAHVVALGGLDAVDVADAPSVPLLRRHLVRHPGEEVCELAGARRRSVERRIRGCNGGLHLALGSGSAPEDVRAGRDGAGDRERGHRDGAEDPQGRQGRRNVPH